MLFNTIINGSLENLFIRHTIHFAPPVAMVTVVV